MTYLLYTCGLTLSAVAAYYSVMGLIAIFSTAVIPIAIMGTVLEASKLVSASWLYRNWNTAQALLKYYFTAAVIVLMMLTSMGIFGYLSKAHLDQAVPTGEVVGKLQIIEDKIKTAKDNIDVNRKALRQMDEAVDQSMARSSDEKGADKAVAIRRGQAKERARLQQDIATEQALVSKLNEEAAPIRSEVRKVEAEVGPIKYIAALLYGDVMDDTILEKAVRIVIIMIVVVFDPLAVLMLITANRESMMTKVVNDQITDAVTQVYEPEPEPVYVADVPIPEPPKETWDPSLELNKPVAETPKEFMDVVKGFFAKKNEDFDAKDPWNEKKSVAVRPNSRRTPDA